ncbi:MAG: B12-binding domain-containing protein [Candidatus Bathyarchaeia archaeon]
MDSCVEQDLLRKMRDSLAELHMKATKEACLEAIREGIDPHRCLIEGLSPGLEIVGKKYQSGEYFLVELIMSGEIMKEAMRTLEPYVRESKKQHQTIGKVVIGAVKGDLHDIGKNIVISLLKASNFDVYDLGSDVSAEEFVKAVRKHKPGILGLSALLTTTLDEMEKVVKELEVAGLRKTVRVIIGGGAVNESFSNKIGADGWSTNAVTGVQQCKRWIQTASFQEDL